MSRIGQEVLRLEEEGMLKYDEHRSIYVRMLESKAQKVEVRYGRR